VNDTLLTSNYCFVCLW